MIIFRHCALAAFACAFTATLFTASVVRAEPQAFRVAYDSGDGCPDVTRFTREITARTNQALPAEGEEPGYRFSVRVSTGGDASRGSMEIADASGAESHREVDGSTCEEVVSALALIAALSIDPNASLAPVSLEPLPAAKEAEPEPTPRALLPLQTPVPAEPPRNPGAPPADLGVPPAPRAVPRAWSWVAGANLAENGAIPGDPIGFSPFVELNGSREAVIGWASRLSFVLAPIAELQGGPGAASFRWMAARAEGCVRIRIVSAIWALPCVGMDAGSLRGEGLSQGAISHPASDTVLWASASATGRIRAEVWKPLFLELAASLVFPFQHQRFVFERPTYEIYEVPWVGRRLEAGLGVHFL